MAKPLFERIQSALGPSARAADVAALIEEVQAELKASEAERDRNHEIAVSVDSDDATADAAADAEAKANRRIVRLNGQIAQLTERRDEMEYAEQQRAAAVLKAEVIAERDQLADDLRNNWPRIEAEILALLWRIRCSDMRLEGYGEPSAEALARNCPAGFHYRMTPIKRLVDMNIPSFDVTSDDGIWSAWPLRGEARHHAESNREFVVQEAAKATSRLAALRSANAGATKKTAAAPQPA
jgi:hypothetical protein